MKVNIIGYSIVVLLGYFGYKLQGTQNSFLHFIQFVSLFSCLTLVIALSHYNLTKNKDTNG